MNWEKNPDIKKHEMAVMPNHFHCIIENINHNVDHDVGADLRVCPIKRVCPNKNECTQNIGQSHRIAPTIAPTSDAPLHRVVQWFKTMTTNEYIRGVKIENWKPFDEKLWQRNYWEHIICNEKSYQTISEYILNNPLEWNNDKLNPDKRAEE